MGQGEQECGSMVGYVDDGAFSYAHEDPAVLSDVLTKKYNLLEEWMHANKLVINPDKTHLMVMASKKNDIKRREVSMKEGEFTIKPSQTEKPLGGRGGNRGGSREETSQKVSKLDRKFWGKSCA